MRCASPVPELAPIDPLVDMALTTYAAIYRRRYPGNTLETCDFIAEARLRAALAGGNVDASAGMADAYAHQILRTVLIDALRRYFAAKRGGADRRQTHVDVDAQALGGAMVDRDADPADALASQQLLHRVFGILDGFAAGAGAVAARIKHARRCRMVIALMLRAGGATNAEIASSLAVSETTAQEDIDFVRAYVLARVPEASDARARGADAAQSVEVADGD